MKRKEIRKQKTIISMTPEEWDTMVNEALESLPEVDGHPATIERTRTVDGGFQAVIDYVEVCMVPETIRDEYNLRGIRFRCEDCPHLQRERSPRFRWLTCELGMKDTTKESAEACGWYYEQVAKAEEDKK